MEEENPMEVTLQPAKAEDAKALIAIQKASFERLYLLYQDEKSPYLDEAETFLHWMEREGIFFWKILCDGILRGGIVYYRRAAGEYYLARIFIDPALQGQGIAGQAIAYCEQQFPDAKSYFLDFPIDQSRNRNCYEKAGYIDTGRREPINDRLTLAFYEKTVHPITTPNLTENPPD